MSFRDVIHDLLRSPAGLALFSSAGPGVRLPRSAEPAHATVPEVAFEHPPIGEILDLSQEIPDLLSRAAPSARTTGCRLEYAVPPGLPACAERSGFRETMAELIRQAIDQAPGGQVLVTASPQRGWIQIGICDDGPGVTPGHQQTAPREPLRFLESQVGPVRIAPHPGQGTVVTFRLRQADARAPRRVAATAPALTTR